MKRHLIVILFAFLFVVFLAAAAFPAGPSISRHYPSGTVETPVSSVDVWFSEEINMESFSAGDVFMTGPDGSSILIGRVYPLEGNIWRIEFPEVSGSGQYHFTIGPEIRNMDWIRMDAAYSGSFSIAGDTPPEPPPGLPDLIVKDITSGPDTNIGAGETVTFTVTIENAGEQAVSQPVDIHYSIGEQQSGYLRADKGILPGETVQVGGNWTAVVGTYWITVMVDDNDVIAETDEMNNSLSRFLADVPGTKPPPVSCLKISPEGDGTAVTLDWSEYDESAHGNITEYRIYVREEAFTDVDGLLPEAVVEKGIKTYSLEGLTAGETLYIAVVAVDLSGIFRSDVSPVQAAAADTEAPDEITGLKAVMTESSLTFTWDHSGGDLQGYRVYFDNDPPVALPPEQKRFERNDLAPATGYAVKITAFDGSGNESIGVSASAVTLLPNPDDLFLTPRSGLVELAWSAVEPPEYVRQYKVYVSDSSFSSVENLKSGSTVTGTGAVVAGLTNGETYYFAVTTVNISGGEQKHVTSAAASPVSDNEGPQLTNPKIGAAVFASGYPLNQSAVFHVNASDPAGISRVEFFIDGNPAGTDYSGEPDFSCYIDILALENGPHNLQLSAWDTLGNSTEASFSFIVALEPPAAPMITFPSGPMVVNTALLTVSGTAEADAEVVLYVNGSRAGTAGVDAADKFTQAIPLENGENEIRASAVNRAGEGAKSLAVLVTLDTTIPEPPGRLEAVSAPMGVVRLEWQGVPDSAVAGYNIYRSDSSFTTTDAAVKLGSSPVTSVSFRDMPDSDGTRYYRVAAVTAAGTESRLSEEAVGVSDMTMPSASVRYETDGFRDFSDGTFGKGRVTAYVTVSEVLQVRPFFSMTPEGGASMPIELSRVSDLAYKGSFVISGSTPSGTAWAVFSARDMAGNRGTGIDSGDSIRVDTTGPEVRRLVMTPDGPVRNDSDYPVQITAVFGLTEPVKNGETPEIFYSLSATAQSPVALGNITEVPSVEDDAQTWQARFTLPADAGKDEPEILRFFFRAQDRLSNIGEKISCNDSFQVYQGELPAPEVPQGLTATAASGGRIALSWREAGDAAAYRLYRKNPGEERFILLADLENNLEFEDLPETEGEYEYGVASVRRENGQEAESAMSATVTAVSDATPPSPPRELALSAVPQGIRLDWKEPAYTEPVTYTVYRSGLSEITSVDGLEPLQKGIGQVWSVDTDPSLTEHSYAVTATDAAGNESAVSNSAYLHIGLLPVSGLSVRQSDDEKPYVSWTHPGGGIAGYDIYIGPEGNEVKPGSGLLTDTAFTDSGYADDERRYTVYAKDDSGHSSLGRSVLLPVIRAELEEGTPVRRGLMNRLVYSVENSSAEAVQNARISVKIGGRTHLSEIFSVPAKSDVSVSVIVGGYADLDDVESATVTVHILRDTGETAEIVRTGDIDVVDGMPFLRIMNSEFVRGTDGSLRFVLENTGGGEMEIITARDSGKSPSGDIRAYLLDEDENIISMAFFSQVFGSGLVTLPDGSTVARLAAGAAFASEPFFISIPENAPDRLTLRLEIENIWYHLGSEDQVNMKGLSATHEVNLTDTSYFGRITGISPETSTGDTDIIITGEAVDRMSGKTLSSAALNLVVDLDGFEREYEVFTGDDGSFQFVFTPLAGEGGIYTVRAVHPELTDRPVHGTFVVSRVSVSPSEVRLHIPKNHEQEISLDVITGAGTSAEDIRLEFAEADQPGGTIPAGIHLSTGDPVTLGPEETGRLKFTVWADNTAPETRTLVLRVKSGDTTWKTVTVDAAFSEAKPLLSFTPGHIETGVEKGGTVSEILTLGNNGLAVMEGVTLALGGVPEWAWLNADKNQGDIPVGEKREIMFSFSPGEDVEEGTYQFMLTVNADNHPETDIRIYVHVTASGTGSVLFKAADIYTGTVGTGGELVEGLADVNITLQNEAVPELSYTLPATDTVGETQYPGQIPAGRYRFRATASNHQPCTGRITVKPGVTAVKEIFLEYNLVTVEWNVTEVTIEDRYEVVLTATYETDVPAPVVILEPVSVTLPEMKAGDVFSGEFTITNYGLVRADSVEFSLPGSDRNFRYELLSGLPETLEAKERLTIPYRVTCINPLGREEAAESGGGCESYISCMTVGYDWRCANGNLSRAEIRSCWSASYGDCVASGGIAGTPSIVSWGGGSYQSGTRAGSAPQAFSGTKCLPAPERKESFCLPCVIKDTLKFVFQNVFSSVNMLMREYTLEIDDISVRVPGGSIAVKRRYYDNRWFWEHTRHNLVFTPDKLGRSIESIGKGGVIYDVSATDAGLFLNGVYRIVQNEQGYLWTSPDGSWQRFDTSGRMTEYGGRSGITGKLLYDEDGYLAGVTDRNDRQVIWYESDEEGGITAVSDVEERRVAYTYTGGSLTGVSDVSQNETVYEYDGNGRIVKTTAPGGRISGVSYDAYGNIASVQDGEGNEYVFEFDYDTGQKEYYAFVKTPSGMTREVWYDRTGDARRVDVNGRTVQTIEKDGRDLVITDENGRVTRKTFDENDNLVRILHPDGSEITYRYDLAINRKIEKNDETGVRTLFEYDERGFLTGKTEAAETDDERITEYELDSDGNILKTIVSGKGADPDAVIVMTYDDSGNMTSVTDPEGNVTRLSHDAMGNVLTREGPDGEVWVFAYDSAGNMKSAADPLNRVTAFEYDPAGNRVREIAPDGSETVFEYDTRGNVTKITDPEGGETLMEYSVDDRLVRSTDEEGKSVRFSYDTEGRLISTTDGSGNTIRAFYDKSADAACSSCYGEAAGKPSIVMFPTFIRQYGYDERGRKTVEKDILTIDESLLDSADSVMTRFVYDPAGNLISRTDRENRTTGYEYDSLGRITRVTDAAGGETLYRYDTRDNLISLTDAKGQETIFEYDLADRLTKEIRPEGEATVYYYSPAGQLEFRIDAENRKTEYLYDDAGQLTGIRYYSVSTNTSADSSVTFIYDAAGRLTGYSDGTSSAVYSYDKAGRKTSETVNYGSLEIGYRYEYFKNGFKKAFTGPDAIRYEYAYDANKQLTSVKLPDNRQITVTAYKWNRPEAVILPGGTTKRFEYDPLMRVKKISVKDPAQTVVVDYTYSYDRMDNILTKNTEHGEYTYDYDDLYRLATADNPTAADEAFTYDPAGNRITASGVTGSITHSANNELTSYGGITYDYDATGSMIRKTGNGETFNYIYSVENRLVRVERADRHVIAEYAYDPFGRRIMKKIGGVATYYLYSDEGLIGEYREDGSEIRTYGYRPGSIWTTDPLLMRQGGEHYFYHKDHLGTPQKMTAVNGGVVWSAKYESFGKVTIEIESVENNLRFAGQYYDGETGLFYNRHRYYNPESGRYLTADPIGLLGGINFFIYGHNNPMKFIDNNGLMVVSPQYQKCIKQVEKKYEKIYEEYINEYRNCLKNCNDIDKLKCEKDLLIITIYKAQCNLKCFYKFRKIIFPHQLKMMRDVIICYEFYQAPWVYPIEPHSL